MGWLGVTCCASYPVSEGCQGPNAGLMTNAGVHGKGGVTDDVAALAPLDALIYLHLATVMV